MSQGVLRLAYVLFALMTVVSFGGPFLFGAVLKGGASPDWPPDRPVEWVAFAVLTAVVVAILSGLGAIWIKNVKVLNQARELARQSRADRGEA